MSPNKHPDLCSDPELHKSAKLCLQLIFRIQRSQWGRIHREDDRVDGWVLEKVQGNVFMLQALQACKIFLLCENLLLNSKLTEETNEGGKFGFKINGILLSGKVAYPRRGYRVWSKNISQHYVTSLTTHSSILAWRIPWTKRSLAGYSPWGHKVLDTTEQPTLDLTWCNQPPLWQMLY